MNTPSLIQTDSIGRKIKTPDLSERENLSYILGVLLGDGCVSESGYQLRLVSIDKSFAESFRDSLEKIGLNSKVITIEPSSSGFTNRKELFLSYAYSKSFVIWFKQLSLNHISQIIEELEDAFVRGIYESDGSLGVVDRENMAPVVRVRIANKDTDLLDFLKEILRDKWKISSIREEYRTCFSETINGYERVSSFLEKVEPVSIRRKGSDWLRGEIDGKMD